MPETSPEEFAMQTTSGFKDKVALVVGGASGMGNAVVRLLAGHGCRLHVLDIRVLEVKQTPGAAGAAGAAFQACDVRDYDQVRACVANVVDREGRIDLLFVAAGVHLFADIEQTSIEEFERV